MHLYDCARSLQNPLGCSQSTIGYLSFPSLIRIIQIRFPIPDLLDFAYNWTQRASPRWEVRVPSVLVNKPHMHLILDRFFKQIRCTFSEHLQ